MDFSSRKFQAFAAGIALVVIIAGILLYHAMNRPPEAVSISTTDTDAPPAPPVLPSHPASRQAAADACPGRGVAVTLGQAKFRIPGPPALTLIVGAGVDDDIDFSTKEGVDKGCSQPAFTARAIALNFDAMDKRWGVAADWRTRFCSDDADEATHFLCEGEDRPKGTPRRLALATVYEPKNFKGEGMFQHPAPQLADFTAWKQGVIKAGKTPPIQPDGPFDVYPGNVWLERNADKPFLFSCDTDAWPVTGQHYCIGTVDLDNGLRARIEFRTVSGEVGKEGAAAETHLRSLLAVWK